MNDREVEKDGSLSKKKLTLRHALWATFYIFLTFTFVSIFVSFLILSIFPKEDFVFTYNRFSPILFLSVLIVLFLYIKTRPDLDLGCLGFKKAGLKKAIVVGLIFGVILGFIPTILARNIFFRASNNLKLLLSHPIIYANGWTSITVGPVFEEAFYRGLWYSVLREKMPYFFAMIIISFVFAILHPVRNLSQYVYLFFISIFYTLLYEKTNNLYSSITFHLLLNFFVILRSLKIGY